MTVWSKGLILEETAKLLDRDHYQPIHAQVSNYLRLAIADGRLPAGARIPSIRELADRLGVASNTIARAYRDLSNEGLIESIPGRGSVVSNRPLPQKDLSIHGTDYLKNILQPAARRARILGFEWNEILHVLEESISVVKVPQSIGLVATSSEQLDLYRLFLETALSDFDVNVIPITMQNLRSTLERSSRILSKVKIIVAMTDVYGYTRSIFEGTHRRVVPLLTELSIQTHNQLELLPNDGPVVLICNKLIQTQIMWLVSIYCHPARLTCLSGITSDTAINAIKQASAIIHDETVSSEQLQEFTAGKLEIKLEFVLNVWSVANLRKLLLVSSKVAVRE